MQPLIGIGYWHDSTHPEFPDPGRFVDEEWDREERASIIEYLRSGHSQPYACGGSSWCRFRCGNSRLGSGEFTDGTYLWPQGLVHYIEKHSVRLPKEVVEFMLSNPRVDSIEDNASVDWTWWNSQFGWNTTISSYQTPTDKGTLILNRLNALQKLKKGDVLRKYLLGNFQVKCTEKMIKSVVDGQEIYITGDFEDVHKLLADFLAVGIDGKFLTADQ